MAMGTLALLLYDSLLLLRQAVQPPKECTHVDLERVPSPDGTWVAVIDEDTCDVGSFSTDITAGVRLFATKPPVRDIDLLGVDTGGNINERPRVVWAGPHLLQVNVLQYSLLKVLMQQVEGVQVDVRFDPIDHTAKPIWLQQHGVPPDPPGDTGKR